MNTVAARLVRNLEDEMNYASFHKCARLQREQTYARMKNEAIDEYHLSESASTHQIVGRERSDPKELVRVQQEDGGVEAHRINEDSS